MSILLFSRVASGCQPSTYSNRTIPRLKLQTPVNELVLAIDPESPGDHGREHLRNDAAQGRLNRDLHPEHSGGGQ